MKWFDSSKLSYGFIDMDAGPFSRKDVLFHVSNVRKNRVDLQLRAGDPVAFIYFIYAEAPGQKLELYWTG